MENICFSACRCQGTGLWCSLRSHRRHISLCAEQICFLMPLSSHACCPQQSEERFPLLSPATQRGCRDEGEKPTPPAMPRYPLCFQNPGPLQNPAYGVPLLCIKQKGWDRTCRGTWTSFRVLYQIQIQFALMFCGFFCNRNTLLLFRSTHWPPGPAREDTPSITAMPSR